MLAAPWAAATERTPAAVVKAAYGAAPKWAPWIEFGGYYGSDKASRGEAALWAPLWQNDRALVFTDIRGKLFEHDIREGNFALGFRHMLSNGWNLGVWAGYDVRRSQFGSVFGQAAGGVELLRDNFDLRFNGYLPLEREKILSSATATSLAGTVTLTGGGTGIAMTTTTTTTTTVSKELALWGVDGEVGARLFGSEPAATGPRYELRAYAGGFYFDHKDLPGQVAGPRGRLELRFDDLLPKLPGSRLTLESEFSYDDVRKDKWEVGARLRIPFGASATRTASLTPQERRMTEALERDTDIVSQSQTTSTSTAAGTVQENVLDHETNVALNTVVNVNNANPGDIDGAGANSLIIADGAGGNLAGARTLGSDVTLMGGGATIAVRGATSGTVANFTAPGARPTLSGAGNATNLSLNGTNIHVAGIDIAGSGAGNTSNRGILIDDGADRTVRIADTAIDNTGDESVRINGVAGDSHTVSLVGMTVSNSTGFGLRIAGPTGHTVSMNNSVFAGNFDDDGIRITNGPHTFSGIGNTAAGAVFAGIFCAAAGAQNGSFAFDNRGAALPTAGTCP